MDSDNVTSDVSVAARATEAAILILIILAALFGNISLWILCFRDAALRRHVATWLMLCLSGADILVSVVNMPTVVISVIEQRWLFSEAVCVALGFICMVTFIASVMSLTSISVYRYALACHINNVKMLYTNKNTLYIIAGTWLFSVVLALPPLVGWGQYGYLPNQSICFCKWKTSIPYTYFMICACFVVPCSVMTFCYVMILKRIRSIKARLMAAGNRGSAAGFDVSTLSCSTSEHDVTKSSQSDRSKQEPPSHVADDASGRSNVSKDGRLTMTGEVSPAKSNVTISTVDTSGEEIQNDLLHNGDDAAGGGERNATTAAGGDWNSDDPVNRANQKTAPSLRANQITITLTECTNNVADNDVKRRSSSCAQSVNVPDTPGSAISKWRTSKISKFRADTKLTLSFFVVIVTFVACWLPFCITMLISVHAEDQVPRFGAMATLILGCFNSCCNPVIYGVMNTKYRPGFAALYCRRHPNTR